MYIRVVEKEARLSFGTVLCFVRLCLLFLPIVAALCYLESSLPFLRVLLLLFLSSPINDIDCALLVLFTPTDDDDDDEEDIKRIRSVSSDREKEERRRTVNRAC